MTVNSNRYNPSAYDAMPAQGLSSSDNDETQSQSGDEKTFRPNDIIIGVMGMTGVGKSTFISLFTDGDSGPDVGHNLQSCTSKVEVYPVTLENGVRVVLIDTPGFDDTERSDTDVLRDIADFLTSMYEEGIRLTGLLYLHRITDVRVQGSAMRNLRMFKSLCGRDSLPSVVLVTTMWSQLPAQSDGRAPGEDRLQDLRDNFWADMLERGSKMLRHDGSQKSAQGILSYLVNRRRPVDLDIQKQMVTEKRNLIDTAAGQEVNANMDAQQDRLKKDMEEFRNQLEEAQRERDMDSARELQRLTASYQEKHLRIEEDKRKLNVDVKRLQQEEVEKAQLHQKSKKLTRWIVRGVTAVAATTATVSSLGLLTGVAVTCMGVVEAGLQISKKYDNSTILDKKESPASSAVPESIYEYSERKITTE